MNKINAKLIWCLLILMPVLSCENLTTSMPETDISRYVSGTTIKFPNGTKAVDIYNTVKHLYPQENINHSLSTEGTFTFIRKTINNKFISGLENANGIDETFNGTITQVPETHDEIIYVRHEYQKDDPEISEYTVCFGYDNISITIAGDGGSSQSTQITAGEIKLIFKWQRQSTNIWKNDELGKAECFISVEMKDNAGQIYTHKTGMIPFEIEFDSAP